MSFLRRLSRFSLEGTRLAPIVWIEDFVTNGRQPISPISQESWSVGKTWLSDVPGRDGFNTVPYTVGQANSLTLAGVVVKEPQETKGPTRPFVKLELVCPVKGGKFFDTVGVFFRDSIMQRICSHVKVNDEVLVKGEVESYQGRTSVTGIDIAFLEEGTGPVPKSIVQEKLERGEKSDGVSSRLMPCLELYNSGIDWIAVAGQLGVKPSTVLGYLGDEYAQGKDVDIDRLCKDAMLGASGSSEFLQIDTFVKAIQEEVQGGGLMSRDELKKVVGRVRITAGSDKLKLQEEIGNHRGIGALVFAQARIVRGMMIRLQTKSEAPF